MVSTVLACFIIFIAVLYLLGSNEVRKRNEADEWYDDWPMKRVQEVPTDIPVEDELAIRRALVRYNETQARYEAWQKANPHLNLEEALYAEPDTYKCDHEGCEGHER